MPSNLTVTGNLEIASGNLNAASNSLNVAGNWINEGTFSYTTSGVTFDGTTDQTITNLSGETFYDLTINKASGTLILDNDVVVSNSLTMTSGNVNAGSSKITLGTGTGSPGSLTYTSGQVIGPFERWITTSSPPALSIIFPVGTSVNYRPASITGFSDRSGITAGTLTVEFVVSNPGTLNPRPLVDDINIYNTFVEGYWDFSSANGFDRSSETINLDLTGNGFTSFTISSTSTRVLTRADSGSDWVIEGADGGVSGSTVTRTGISNIQPGQFCFGDNTNCTPPSNPTITGDNDVCTGDNDVSYSVTLNSGNTYSWTATGGTIDPPASGVNVNSITVDWGGTGMEGNVTVVENNGCTSSEEVEFTVAINSIAPTSISGKTAVAASTQDEPYSVTSRSGYTYIWNITGGAIDLGQGSASITVDWETAGTGNVSVVAQASGCAVAQAFDTDVSKYIVILSNVALGDWDAAGTWDCNCIPASTENTKILDGHTVQLTADEEINHAIVDVGGTLDANTNNKKFIVNGDLVIDGTYTGGTKVLELNGVNVIIDGIGTISMGSTLNFTNGNKTIASAAVLNLSAGNLVIFSGGISVTNNGSLTIADDITANADNTWTNAANSSLKIGGELMANGDLVASASGNTVNYNGTGAQNVKTPTGSDYHHLSAEGSGTKTVLASLDLGGNLTIDGTATLDVATNTSDLNVAGNWTNNSTFTQGTQTVTMDGSSAQTISGTSTTTFNNLVINNTGSGITLSAPVNTNATFTLTDGIVTTDNTNIITLANASTVSGSSDASFVIGPMEKNTNTTTTFTFPVGKTSSLRTIGITPSSTAATTWTAEYFDTEQSFGATVGAGLVKISSLEYWVLDQSGTTNGDVILSWNPSSAVADLVDLRVARWDGSTEWVDAGNAGTTGDAMNGTITSNTLTSFSPFTLGSSTFDNPLPVELLEFSAVIIDRVVEIRWATASEKNNDFFTIERSWDGLSFSHLFDVDGTGNSNQITRYQATDESPIPGLSYYRLKQTDFDGQFDYSPVISVFFESEEAIGLEIYPNPATTSNLNLRLNQIKENQKVSVLLLDLAGRRIFEKGYITATNYSSQMTISPNLNLKSGVYIVNVLYRNQVFRKKLIVK